MLEMRKRSDVDAKRLTRRVLDALQSRATLLNDKQQYLASLGPKGHMMFVEILSLRGNIHTFFQCLIIIFFFFCFQTASSDVT